MENFAAGFAVLGALLVVLANVSVSEAQTENKYFKAGGELRLSPVPVKEKIFSIVWKYDKNLLAEWVNGSIELTYYSKFRGRSELATGTGELVVRNMASGDKGVYSVEINNQVQSKVYKTVEIQQVPKPTVDVKPLACGSTSESCRLICEGEIAQAGPVTYFWKKDNGEWEESKNIMEIFNNKETWPVKTFSCMMRNPVSQNISDPISNKFYKNPDDTSSGGGNAGIIATVIVVILLLIAAGVVVYMYKCKLLCFKKHGEPVSTKEEMTVQPSPPNANGGAVDSV